MSGSSGRSGVPGNSSESGRRSSGSRRKKRGCLPITGLILFLGLVILLFIDTAGSAPETGQAGEPLNRQGALEIGETGRLTDTEWSVLEAKDIGNRLCSHSLFTADRETEGTFIQIVFQVKNLSGREINFNPFIQRHHPRLYDAEGREFKYIDSLSSFLPEDLTATDSWAAETAIPAGLYRTFGAIYEVPKDAADFAVMFKPVSAGPSADSSAGRSEEKLIVLLGF